MGLGRRAVGAMAVVAGCTLVSAALASSVEKVRVGVTGRNATHGLSASLYVDVPVVADYTEAKFDGEQGDWTGPDYTATQKPGSDRTDLFFRSDFENTVGSLDGMASKGLVHKTWKQDQRSQAQIPRLLAGRTVGSATGELGLWEEPITGSARFEAVLAVPLCNKVFGAIDFYADAPPQDTSASAGQYLVGTTPAKQWNHDHVLAAAQGVKLDGPLPGGRVTAHGAARKVSGKVADCGGGLDGVPLVLQRKAGAGWATSGRSTSGASGSFAIVARAAGSYRVLAALGPFKATSAAVAIR